jgi:hypothetical protein
MESACPTYADWIAHCFDHPVSDPAWHFDVEAPSWAAPTCVTLEYLTRLFNTSIRSVGQFTDAQLNQGFWYLASPSCSDHMFTLVDTSLPEAGRVACLNSMKSLFGELFATRCTNALSNGRAWSKDLSELNAVCYMWWDIIPVYGRPDDPARRQLDAEVLAVLQCQLESTSLACQESALHGLGHWAVYYPQRVEAIIASYLQRQSQQSPLRHYAVAASAGDVQ